MNFRDIGGYGTQDGRTVRWDRVYRSGSLYGLTDEDLAYLSNLDLRISCDLRSGSSLMNIPTGCRRAQFTATSRWAGR
ncbi:MAG: tyrosine-protein phosphatase [Chloroflexota bacterium]